MATPGASFSGIADYTIDGFGPSGVTGAIGATVFFKDLMYLADCDRCESIYYKPVYDKEGNRIDGTQPTGATGWYFGASAASYSGTDFTDPDQNIPPTTTWGQRSGSIGTAVSTGLADPPTYIDSKYVDCYTCGCPLNHADNKDWFCEITVEVKYLANTRFQPTTLYIIQDPQKAQEEMYPNLSKILPKLSLMDSYQDILYGGGSAGATGSTSPIGATGYYIIDGRTGSVVGATGSSSFTSAYSNLTEPTKIPLTQQQIDWYNAAIDELRDEIKALLGKTDDHKPCPYGAITKKRAIFEISGQCSGNDPEDLGNDIEECYCLGAWDYNYFSYYGYDWRERCNNVCTSFKYCCCTDCVKSGISIDSIWDDPFFNQEEVITKRKTIKITAEDLSCQTGTCRLFYAFDYGSEFTSECTGITSVNIINPRSTDDDSADAYFRRDAWLGGYGFNGNYYDFSGANLYNFMCTIPSVELQNFCGTEDNPDIYGGNQGSNTNNNQYDYTLDNNQYQ